MGLEEIGADSAIFRSAEWRGKLRTMNVARMAILMSLPLLLAGGCVSPSATTRPADATIDTAPNRPDWWFAKPAVVSVPSTHYDFLINQCGESLRGCWFKVDRVDYRMGLVYSLPLISKQIWEVWHSDVVDSKGLWTASMGTVRRTVHWEVTDKGDGRYEASPKVVVERFTAPPRRVTSVTSYHTALSGDEAQTTLTGQNLKKIGEGNWYAIGRDEPLEKVLAKDLRGRLGLD
jgi:hypothetical protein